MKVREYLFTKGRFFIHKPWDSLLGKASDPYIKLSTLALLSFSDEMDVRSAVVANLAARLTRGFKPAHLNKFNEDLIIQALIRISSIAQEFIGPSPIDREGELHPLLVRMMEKTFPSDLARLTTSPCLKVRVIAAGLPRTPRGALLRLAHIENNLAGITAFQTLKNSLQPDELESLAASPNPLVLTSIIRHPLAKRETLVNLAVAGGIREYEGRSITVGRDAYRELEKKGFSESELRSLSRAREWDILFPALARPEFPRDRLLELVASGKSRVAEEAWKNLDKRSLTRDELHYLSDTRSGLAKIEIEKALSKAFW